MIVCPNCNHQNPDGAVQCEACYTPLPALASCPSCGASVQSDASFCGQCGFNLRTAGKPPQASTTSPGDDVDGKYQADVNIPDLLPPDPLVEPEPITESDMERSLPTASSVPSISPLDPVPPPPPVHSEAATAERMAAGATQIQINQAKLLHVQTNTPIELSPQLTLIHIGKPNDRVPPTIDVSGFPNSEIVSRVHANIRIEGDVYYIEDVGSSNGTYVNNMPLPPGNRHRLRSGDRVALGKGDKVTFIFQLT